MGTSPKWRHALPVALAVAIGLCAAHARAVGTAAGTDITNTASVTDLLPGEYMICEEPRIGWEQAYPATVEEAQCHRVSLRNDCEQYAEGGLVTRVATRNSVQTYCEFNFGNQLIPAVLNIDKFNSQWPAPQAPGAVIDYTIIVSAEDNIVNDVLVTDLPPEGFEYVPGSWFASSNLGAGHVGALELSHVYASPGEWNLGDMQPGEKITLSNKAAIGGSQQPGVYKDLAWARGVDGNENQVLANSVAASAPDGGVVNGNFVGTQIALNIPTSVAVELDEDEDVETDTKTKRVLGAALPATGASPVGPMVALILLIIGFNLVMEAKKRGGTSTTIYFDCVS